MTPRYGSLWRGVALAIAVILAGQLLQHVIGYLIAGLVVWAIISRFVGRR
ncbi:hypothetical protein ATKI12_2867 [Kitasatospora sp. Ki12]